MIIVIGGGKKDEIQKLRTDPEPVYQENIPKTTKLHARRNLFQIFPPF